MTKNAAVLSVLLAAISCGALFFTGCTSLSDGPAVSTPAPASAGVRIIVGLDDSVGFEPHLGGAAAMTARLGTLLDPDEDRVALVKFDRTAEPFYDDVAPESGEALRILLVRTLRVRPHQAGTRPATFWTLVARRCAADPHPAIIVCFSDGDQDYGDAADEAALRTAGQTLAHNSGIQSVVFCGASPGNWVAWRQRFQALDATNRLHFIPLDSTALDRLENLIHADRS